MSSTTPDAPLDGSDNIWISNLAELYDKFAHSLDPFSEERDRAEAVFMQQVSVWYDMINSPKPTLHEFRKGVILERFKKYCSRLAEWN